MSTITLTYGPAAFPPPSVMYAEGPGAAATEGRDDEGEGVADIGAAKGAQERHETEITGSRGEEEKIATAA